LAARLRVWSSLGGIAFTVLVVIGSALLFDGPSDSSPAKMTAWYSSGTNRSHLNIGWVLTGLGLLCLIWFVAGVRERIATAEQADAAGGSFLSTLVTIGGTAFVAAGVCLIGVADGIKTMSDDTYQHRVYPELIHLASDAGYVIHSGGGGGAAAMMVAASIAVLRAGSLPVWVAWLGILAGISAIFSIFFFPWIVIAVWLTVASIALFVASGRDQTP
jgi:hypothetical protein